MILSKKPPYSSTEADPERTESQINKLLRDYGITKYQWTKDYDHNQVFLTFEIEAEISGVRKKFGVKVNPPTFAKQRMTWDPHLGKHVKVYAPNWAQSYRLLYHWLKAKIEAVAYGLVSAEQEFLSQVIISLPSGEIRTVGEMIVDPESQYLDPERLSKMALEEKPQPKKEGFDTSGAIEP